MQRDSCKKATSYLKKGGEFSDGNFELESEIKMLDKELREVVAVVVSLYSVVTEYGSSINKVHTLAQ